MNLILESPAPVPCFTDLGAILKAAGIDVRSFDWYVSDVETNIPMPGFDEGDCWLTGDDLARVVQAERLQFIWGVFSAVRRGVRPHVESVPFADGNGTFWRPDDVRPQLPEALFEIVCWDSSAVILVGMSDDQAATFRARFPDAKPLSEARKQLSTS